MTWQRPPGPKYELIRECAGAILAALAAGADIQEATKSYSQHIRGLAYRLLRFENLISKQSVYKLTDRGTKQFAAHGPVVYPNGGRDGRKL